MKNQKGITLAALVATVIVTIILAAVTTYAGIHAYADAKIETYIAKMKVIQQRVDLVSQQYNTKPKQLNYKSFTGVFNNSTGL